MVHFFKFLLKQETRSKEVPIENSLDMEIDTFVSESKEITDEPISEIDPIPEIYPQEKKEGLEMEVEHVMEEESVEGNLAQSLVEKHGFFDPKLELSKYQLPTHELLKDYGEGSKDNAAFPKQPEWFKNATGFDNIENGLKSVGFNNDETNGILGDNWFNFYKGIN